MLRECGGVAASVLRECGGVAASVLRECGGVAASVLRECGGVAASTNTECSLTQGHLVLDEMQDVPVESIIVPDCSISPLLQHTIDKVLIPATAVLPEGDLKTISFGATLTTVARLYKKEVCVYCSALAMLDPHSGPYDRVDGREH